MDLRTFVKPDRPPPAPLPRVGHPAPPLPGAPPALGRPRIVAFLRHVGCPFAELTMKTLDQASVRHPEVQFLAVSQGTPAATRRWCAELQMGYGVMVIDDPAGDVYAAWGLGLTTLRHFLGIRSVGRAVSLLRPAGVVDFDGQHVDCLSESILVEPGTWVRCLDVKPGRVLVRPIDEPDLRKLENADFS